jgi:hypothetical protein
MEKWGCSTLDDITAELASAGAIGVTRELVREVLSRRVGFRWLDEEAGWFWLDDVPRNPLINKIDKILAVSSRIELSALRVGVARHYRTQGFSPPLRVLRALCEQLSDCELVAERFVVDGRPRTQAEELSSHELSMVEVFKAHGPLLSHAEVRSRCQAAGLNDTTTTMALGNSPILTRVDVGVYSLIGASVAPGEVGAITREVKRSRQGSVVVDYGWNPHGPTVWVLYRLSAGILRSGVLSVPSGIQKYLTSNVYELHGADGVVIGKVGMGDGNMWGYQPFFRRRGGDVGDYMRVTFDLTSVTASAELIDEAPDDEASKVSPAGFRDERALQ